MMKREKLSW